MQSQLARGVLRFPDRGFCCRCISGVAQHGDAASAGNKLVQEREALGDELMDEKIYTSHVAARPREARDKTKLDRIVPDTEHDRDLLRRGFGRERAGRKPGRGDHRHVAANQIRQQTGYLVIFSFEPVKLNRDVTSLDQSRFAYALSEGGTIACRAFMVTRRS